MEEEEEEAARVCTRGQEGMVDGLWVGRGWLMDPLVLALVLHGLLTWSALAYGLYLLDARVAEAIDDLDGNLAQAIQAVIQGAQDIEPVSPIQAAIAGYIQNALVPENVTPMTRDSSGKFSAEENNNA